MAIWKNEAEAREQIKNMVTEYYHEYKEKKEQIQLYLFPNLHENYLTISLTLAALPTLSLK